MISLFPFGFYILVPYLWRFLILLERVSQIFLVVFLRCCLIVILTEVIHLSLFWGNIVKWWFNLIPSETNSMWCYCPSGLRLHPPPSCDPPVKWCVQRVTKFHVYFALCLGCIFCSFDVFVDSCLVTLNHSKSRIFAVLGLAAYPALYQHFLGSFCAQQF